MGVEVRQGINPELLSTSAILTYSAYSYLCSYIDLVMPTTDATSLESMNSIPPLLRYVSGRKVVT